jgi:hypothetical protein
MGRILMSTVLTEKGTKLPLINLKGKSYLMVAHRLQWLTEKEENYVIDTSIVSENADQAILRAKITILTPDGKVKKQASATKVETKKDFNDYLEKAETAAIGRALAMLGFGTQHALSDLDEGERIVDTPLKSTKADSKGDF